MMIRAWWQKSRKGGKNRAPVPGANGDGGFTKKCAPGGEIVLPVRRMIGRYEVAGINA
jgi:hypothetical protein